jgi:hypothetical protein
MTNYQLRITNYKWLPTIFPQALTASLTTVDPFSDGSNFSNPFGSTRAVPSGPVAAIMSCVSPTPSKMTNYQLPITNYKCAVHPIFPRPDALPDHR